MATAKTPAPGSPEDIKLTHEILEQFWNAKLKAAELYRAGGGTPVAGTANTQSVCHIDGTTDPN